MQPAQVNVRATRGARHEIRKQQAWCTLKYFLTDEAKRAGISVPSRAYAQDAGIDLRAVSATRIEAGGRAEIPTGTGFEIPEGYFGLICNRTSLARNGLLPLGHVVDAGYRGEIVLILANLDPHQPIEISSNERVAQMVVIPILHSVLEEAARTELGESMRGDRRFGSSGTL